MCDIFICFFFKQRTAYELRISDWSSDVCSSDLLGRVSRCLQSLTLRRRTRQCATTPLQSLQFEVAQPLSVVPRGAESHSGLWGTENHHWSVKGNSISAICIGMSAGHVARSEEPTSELQSPMRISDAVFCLKNITG